MHRMTMTEKILAKHVGKSHVASVVFFFNDTATPEIYTLSLHDALPTWLIEGFADYVGYSDTGLPVGVVAQDLRTEVRAGHWPGTLPADRDYRSDAPGLAVAYETGWTACRFIASRAGPAGLVRFYRLVGTGGRTRTGAVEVALRQVLRTGYAGFVAQWRGAVRAERG